MDNVGVGSIFGGGSVGAPGGIATTKAGQGIFGSLAGYGLLGTFPMQQSMQMEQQKMEAQRIKTQSAVAKQQAASQALAASQNFRQSLSAQLATSALRSAGGGSIGTQFATASMAAMFQDEASYKQQIKYIDLAQQAGLADSKTRLRAQQIAQLSQFAQAGIGQVKGGLSGGAPGGVPGSTLAGTK